MDLIYTNKEWEDEGVLKDYAFDLALGADENDFEVVIVDDNHCCEAGSMLYIEGTEYGGIVDGIKVVTKDNALTYMGRTWHGVLESKVFEPDIGEDYLYVSGEANAVIGSLLEKVNLADLFTVSTEDSGLTISNYKMDRYIDAYNGIMKMLSTVSGKLQLKFSRGKVVLSAMPSVDYSRSEAFDRDQVEMEVNKRYNRVNHLICLGKGELADRLVVHLFVDADGNVSENQTFFGLNEYAEVYDNSNAESREELVKGGTSRLKKSTDAVNMNFDAEKNIYDIGDIVGAIEHKTGIVAREKITKKIVTIKNGQVNIEYKVGEAK